MKRKPNQDLEQITPSLIRSINNRATEIRAVNLSQGTPDDVVPNEIVQEFYYAAKEGFNSYAPPIGIASLRYAIAEHSYHFFNHECDPDDEVTVTCGATEAMTLAINVCTSIGDEVAIFDPTYENYIHQVRIAGRVPRLIPLTSSWQIDFKRLERLITSKTTALILCNPNNPCGVVYNHDTINQLIAFCERNNIFLITDEPYEHIVFQNADHVRAASLPNPSKSIVTVGSASKTFNCTGWRIGYVIARPDITIGIRKLKDYNTMCSNTPAQIAVAQAYKRLKSNVYVQDLALRYEVKRNLLCDNLERLGVQFQQPSGAYYVLANIRPITQLHASTFQERLLEKHRLAVVPGAAFSATPEIQRDYVRLCFCKSDREIVNAIEILRHAITERAFR